MRRYFILTIFFTLFSFLKLFANEKNIQESNWNNVEGTPLQYKLICKDVSEAYPSKKEYYKKWISLKNNSQTNIKYDIKVSNHPESKNDNINIYGVELDPNEEKEYNSWFIHEERNCSSSIWVFADNKNKDENSSTKKGKSSTLNNIENLIPITKIEGIQFYYKTFMNKSSLRIYAENTTTNDIDYVESTVKSDNESKKMSFYNLKQNGGKDYAIFCASLIDNSCKMNNFIIKIEKINFRNPELNKTKSYDINKYNKGELDDNKNSSSNLNIDNNYNTLNNNTNNSSNLTSKNDIYNEIELNKSNLKHADEMYERLEFEQAFTMYKELEGKQGISQSHIKNRINTIESILSQRKTNIPNQSYNDKKSSINNSNKSTENSSKEKNKSKNTLNNSNNKDNEKENKDRKEDNKKDESDDIAEVIRRQNSYDREKKRERDSRNGNAQAVTGTQLAGWISVILFMFDGMGKGDKDNVFKDEFADHFSFKICPSIESVPSMILEKKEIYNARTNKYSYKEEISNASGGGMGFQGSLSYWPVYSNLFGFGAELEGSAAFIFGSYSYSGSFGFNSLIGFDEFQFYSKLERGMRRAGFSDFASTREDELIDGGSKSKYSAFSIGPRFNWGRRKHLTVAIRFEDQNLNSFKHKSIKHWDKGLFFQYSKDNFLDITLLLQATSLFRKHFSNKFSNATLSNNRSYFNLSVKRHFDVFGKYSRKMVKNKKNIKKNKVTNQRVYLLNGTISKLNFKKDFRKNTHLQLGTTLTRYEMEKNLIDNLSIGYGIGTSFETLQWYNYYPNTEEINLFHLNVPINLYYSFPKFANKFFDFEENIDFWLSTGYRFNYTIMQNDKNEKFEINKIGHYYSFGFGFDYSIFRSGFEFNIRNNDIYKDEKIKSLGISYIFGILI